jgi:hypothetical protein
MTTDIVRRDSADLPEDPLTLALQAALANRRHLIELGGRVDALEGRRGVAAETREWPTLRGFILRYEVRPMLDMSDQHLALLGQKIASWHNARHLHYRRKAAGAYHDVHGSVNRYAAENLHLYFTSSGYTLNEETFGADRDASR